MKNSDRVGVKRFRAVVAGFLAPLTSSDESAVRKSLRSKGPSYIKWYDTRLGAIAEFERSTDFRRSC